MGLCAPVQLRVLPRVGAVLVLAEQRPADVPAEHLRRHVVDAPAGDGRREPVRVPDDPGRQVAAVGAAGDTQPSRVDQAVGDQRIDAAHDVAPSARRPSRGSWRG